MSETNVGNMSETNVGIVETLSVAQIVGRMFSGKRCIFVS